jgi:hypothetical protein
MKKFVLGVVIAALAMLGIAAQPASAIGDWPHAGSGSNSTTISADGGSTPRSNIVGDWPHA